ncbi:MAG: LAO/AO transport system kinase [Saprospiraceae bacterium]|jgi:LAO/AO transport system kinase
MGKGINPNLKLKSKALRSVEEYLDGLKISDRFILSEVLTLIESKNISQRNIGDEILNAINTSSNSNSIRIGITGSPGAGKSTFIEALGSMLTSLGKRVAVLAVDPSSTKSQGSILGDKTRMSTLSLDKNAFVRPTASANILGGVARATKESIALCEAAGYEIILVESVGVGQSETELADLVDLYLLLLLPGGGDGVQGIKRGVVELADLLVINKYDGDSKLIAEKSKKDFASAVRLFHHDLDGWNVPVTLCSSLKKERIGDVWSHVDKFFSLSRSQGYFEQNRIQQDQKWIKNQVKIKMMQRAQELFMLDDHSNEEEQFIDESVFERLHRISSKIDSDFKEYINRKSIEK